MKDYLTTREVDFVAINIQEDDHALDDLRKLGVMALPVVVRGERFAIGLDMKHVYELIDLDEAPPELLPAPDLVDRIEQIVPAASRLAAQLPTTERATTIPGRDRTYLGLANHIVAHVEIFLTLAHGADFTLEGVDIDVLRGLERRVDDPPALRARADIALRDLREWFGAAAASELERVVHTFFGEQTVHALLGSCAYSVAQHSRQLMAVLETLGIDPNDPLTEVHYQGIELPAGIWD